MSDSEPRFNSLDAWLSWMEALHPSEIDLGLSRVQKVAARLGVLAFDAPVVMVAGTNGKGSFVKALSDLSCKNNITVGAYTSPHISRYNERIRVNNVPVEDDVICRAFQEIDRAREEISLTYFEFGTLAALVVFKALALDLIVLEVGLGGRLDAVNIVDADICVITSIGLDHQDWLGDNRESIGREKAGILRKSVPFVCVEDDVPHSIISYADELKAHTYLIGRDIFFESDSLGQTSLRCLRKTQGEVFPLTLTLSQAQLPLPSLLAAAQVFLLLHEGKVIDDESIAATLSDAKLEGRFEKIALPLVLGEASQSAPVEFILDVAHNPQAAELLANKIVSAGLSGLTVVIASMKDKDMAKVCSELAPYVDNWVCTEIPGMPRSMACLDLSEIVREQVLETPDGKTKVFIEHQPSNAFRLAALKRVDGSSPVLVLGSFYLVSAFKNQFLSEVKSA